MTRARELLKGTLDLLVMRTLAIEPMHGWGIAERLREMSADAFDVNDGSLYPALQRLKSKGRVRSKWGTTENNRRARYHGRVRARGFGLSRPAVPTVYVPFLQHPTRFITYVVGSDADPEETLQSARTIIRAIDPEMPLEAPLALSKSTCAARSATTGPVQRCWRRWAS